MSLLIMFCLFTYFGQERCGLQILPREARLGHLARDEQHIDLEIEFLHPEC